MKKKQSNKINYSNLDVFNNYKCDGQLVMKFNDNHVEFIEEVESKEETINNVNIT